MTPIVEVPPTLVIAQSLISQPEVGQPTMSFEELKMFGRFVLLAPLGF